ncbi:MAG: 50S ribosomal protein L17 [Candidatus Pacebacteria bacterium]|nr:50S ribosomal protein L17 [Candidatus Paceibacterota bacterium]
MRHHNTNRKFGRVRKQRKALLRSLAISLVDKEKIQTTEAKAKELRPFIEKLITRAKKDSFISRRLILSKLGGENENIVKKLIENIAIKYKDRAGGYTRITKLGFRKGDGSPMSQIELI